jgi:cyclopropane fatty-acyl-phospholipid synthase-like methyltransferase
MPVWRRCAFPRHADPRPALVQTMKSDYPGHDSVYQKRRREGRDGWDGDEAEYAKRKRRLQDLLVGLPLSPGSGILEVGCGAGNIALFLASLGYLVHGVDIAPTAIQWARDKAQALGIAATFEAIDVCADQALSGRRFDAVLDGHCLHCIVGEDRKRFLAMVHRVLPAHGVLVVDTMCGPVTRGPQGYDAQTGYVVHQGIATRYIGEPAAIEREIDAGGFAIQRIEREDAGSASEVGVSSMLIIARRR